MCHATANVMNLSRNVLSNRKIHKMKKKIQRNSSRKKKSRATYRSIWLIDVEVGISRQFPVKNLLYIVSYKIPNLDSLLQKIKF